MNDNQPQLITLKDLINIGFTSECYINNSILNIENDFVSHLNTDLLSYYREKNLPPFAHNKLADATDALLTLITPNEYEVDKFKDDAEYYLNDSDTNTVNINNHFDALEPTPVNAHRQKLKLINQELKKYNQGLFGNGNRMSIGSLSFQLVALQEVIQNLSKSDPEYQEIERKKYKEKIEMKFVKTLYRTWKIFTGTTKSLYTDNEYNNPVSGEFFSLVKMCFLQP